LNILESLATVRTLVLRISYLAGLDSVLL
jgi:hypothetical protein